ncbi:MAG: hypothetical protein H0V36_04560 [Chloroflexi bacterium]|nr:hypothetical protein [Chloroflexota bacterium]
MGVEHYDCAYWETVEEPEVTGIDPGAYPRTLLADSARQDSDPSAEHIVVELR